jgi:hypothetical protein
MALNAGNADCTLGLSKRIYDYWVADPESGFVDPLTIAAQRMIRAQCYAVARAVVDEITANAAVSVPVDADEIDTGIPPAPITLTGTVA